jgi:hypothetical protein
MNNPSRPRPYRSDPHSSYLQKLEAVSVPLDALPPFKRGYSYIYQP